MINFDNGFYYLVEIINYYRVLDNCLYAVVATPLPLAHPLMYFVCDIVGVYSSNSLCIQLLVCLIITLLTLCIIKILTARKDA